jgi:hypothetical protein
MKLTDKQVLLLSLQAEVITQEQYEVLLAKLYCQQFINPPVVKAE